MPFFLADRLGMSFKHKNVLITHLGKDAQLENSQRKHWLFIPWENISNIRVSKVTTHDGSFNGAVLDVIATKEELDQFFGGRRVDEKLLQDDSVTVAFYMNVPPTPRKVVAVLQDMMSRYKKSFSSARYNELGKMAHHPRFAVIALGMMWFVFCIIAFSNVGFNMSLHRLLDRAIFANSPHSPPPRLGEDSYKHIHQQWWYWYESW